MPRPQSNDRSYDQRVDSEINLSLRGDRASIAYPMQVLTITSALALVLFATTGGQGIAPESPGLPPARSVLLSRPQGRGSGFTRLNPVQTGLNFTNRVSLKAVAQNRLIEDGSGVAAGDFDGDGLCDLYFCNLEGANRLFRNIGGMRFEDITASAVVGCPGQASTGVVLADIDGDGDLDLLVNGLGAGTRVFLNDGHGKFVERTDSGLARDSGARTLALADIDGDGDLDLYVANYRRTTARDGTERVTVTRRGNGFEVPVQLRDRYVAEMTDNNGVMVLELGEPDVLYRNVGGGGFESISWTGGAFLDENGRPLKEPPRDWGLSAMFHDLNGDGLPDLYVCNDFHSPDRIWLNKGRGHFQAVPSTLLRKTSFASMAVDFADINRDGFDDIFVAEMLGVTRLRRQTQRDNVEGGAALNFGWGWRAGDITNTTQVMRNTLFLNQGDGTFAEIAQLSGVHASDWTWGSAFLDVDLDGYEDLLMANGHLRDHLNSDVQARLAPSGPPQNAADRERLFGLIPGLAVPKRIFRNRGDMTFEDRSTAWGFDWVGISNGMAFADLDNDGDLDVILNNLDAGAFIMRNDTMAPRIAIRLRGLAPNTSAIGAKIRVLGGSVPQSQEVISGGRYLSSDDPLRVFATGQATELDIEVAWRSGKRTVVNNAKPNCIYEISEEGAEEIQSPKLKGPWSVLGDRWSVLRENERGATDNGQRTTNKIQTLFEDVSDRVNRAHQKIEFNDYERQPLLPRRLSQNGPGVSWLDLNGDGHDELLLGSGRGKHMQVWSNDGKGKFDSSLQTILSTPTRGDQTTILGWRNAPGTGTILVGLSGYEVATNLPASIGVFSVSAGGIQAVDILGASANVGPLAAADFDGDGDIDVFVGGQAEPGRYPVAARSVIFRQAQGRFNEDMENTRPLAGVGLVNGAVWSDLNGDGNSDLVLACEWGPLRLFRNNRGTLTEWNPPVSSPASNTQHSTLNSQLSTLNSLTGWWNGVAAGDFNGDGQMDLVASNWGRNTKYQEFIGDELRVYHGDLDGSGTWEVIESCWDRELMKEVPWRDYKTMCNAVPRIRERFATYASYGTASVEELFGDALKRAQSLRANTLESMLFLNRGDRFEACPLPFLAQLTPAFGILVADFDGDGHEDVFLSQNSFAADRETGRYDGGRGLLLRGDDTGNFVAAPAAESGLAIHGEQRGAAVADFDSDGRADIAVTQHAAPLKLFRNRGARPGLRVRLAGPPGNLNGIGAQVRLRFGESYGPVREIHAGSGYWSQDSFVMVLAKPRDASHVWVRWPGGRTTETPLPSPAFEVSVASHGELRLIQ